jgi:small conductance mechanosensitive channel
MKINEFYDQAYKWILTYGPRIIIAVVLLIVGLWLIKVIKNYLKSAMGRRELDHSLQPFLLSLIITVLRVLLLLAVMQVLGIQMTIFAAIIGAAGVAAGLALSGTLQNFAGGVLILLLKPFEVGDNIIAQGQDGSVSSIQIFYTVIKTSDNRTVIIPNGKLFNEVIVNVTREGKRRLELTLKVGYSTDIDELRELIADIIKKSNSILIDPEPRIAIMSLEPDGIIVTVRVWANAHSFLNTRFELNESILNGLKKKQVVLPADGAMLVVKEPENAS